MPFGYRGDQRASERYIFAVSAGTAFTLYTRFAKDDRGEGAAPTGGSGGPRRSSTPGRPTLDQAGYDSGPLLHDPQVTQLMANGVARLRADRRIAKE